MAGPIARRPAGLLDLLLTQQQGKNPSELGDVVSPTIDLTSLYEQEVLATTIASITADAVNDFSSIIIPDGEAWKLLASTVHGAFADANEVLSMGHRIQTLPGSGLIDQDALNFAAVGATDLFGGSFVLPANGTVIYPPGTRFITFVRSITLGVPLSIVVSVDLLHVTMQT